ncbi:DUF222 domain-containing protein, partial [Kribbella sp. NPDC051952]|uniref:HNH endonuclease n=1 Tax=Kribbella sp. NPDC051952 TaxID=3154851 RepID=UPI00343C21BD
MEIPDERPIWSMSGSELLSALDTNEAAIARLQADRIRMIARLDEIGHAQHLGATTTAELLAMRYRLDRRDAHREVKLARTLPRYTTVSSALPNPAGPLETPVLRPAQAQAIVLALETVPDRVPVENIVVAEQQLVNLAQHLSPGELRKVGKEIRDLLDTDGPEPAEHKAYERESLTLTDADHGITFRGFLANENAELLRSLIHAHARPHKTADGELDPRSREKRQADALTTTLTTAATATESGAVPGAGAKANITVTIDLHDLKTATPDAIGHVIHGDALSAATIRRLACDAKIIPLVLGSNSEPLDVGRAERLVTPAMRRALNARDKGCVICGAPPISCDAHHLISWIDGGQTAINNLALICRRHHTALHAGHWTITIT